MLDDKDIEKLKSVFGTKADFDVLAKTTNDLTKSLDVVATNVLKITTDVAQIQTDLSSFKSETRESFEKLEKSTKENEENINGIVTSYHPHIIAIEEKLFGHSTLSEA